MFRRLLSLPAAALSGNGSAALSGLPEWDLSDLYEGMDSPRFTRDIEAAEEECKSFAQAYRGTLQGLLEGGRPEDALHAATRRFEALEDLLGRIISYAGLVYAGDTTDPKRAKFYGDVQERLTAASSDLLFFQLEINRLDDERLAAAATRAPLAAYRPWLEDIRKEKPYQLDDKLEQLFHEKSVTSRAAWNRLFDETISSLKFRIGDEDLTLEPALNKLQDSSEPVRRQASEALAKTLAAHGRIFTLITNTLAKDKEIADRWRGFEDVADSRTIGWGEARDTVLSAYSAFSPRMAEIAGRFFDRRWIDAPVRPGKAPGAFAHPTVPSAHPYVLLNYQGRPRDVMTLAHELGHGVHQVLAAPNGALMAPTPLTLAETASVFGEMLTFRALLARTDDPLARKAMLAAKVEDMINTVVRQIAFYTFEREVHTRRASGELTTEQLGEIWLEVQRESLGPAIRLAPGYETYWAYIPHFIHSPFYVYAYAFGDCLVNSLYGVYEKAADGFAERYLAMLAAGGTKHHPEVLAPFGLDARDPAFWSIGLDLIDRMITDLEALG